MAEDEIICGACGSRNPKGLTKCHDCGAELKTPSAGDVDEIDKLLESILDVDAEGEAEAKEPDSTPGGEIEEKEMIDELLDSLLIEEEKKGEGVDVFECPLCSTMVSVDAKACPNCGAEFVESKEGEVEAEAPAVEEVVEEVPEEVEAPKPKPVVPVMRKVEPRPVEVEPVRAADRPAAPKVEVSEAEIPKTHIYDGRIIDITIIITIVALITIFLVFQMYYFSNLNAGTLGAFFGVVLMGMFIVYFFFRISTSAVAQGDKLVKQGMYAEAIQMYDRGIRLGIRPGNAWTSKGVAYKRLGEYENALKCHNLALKLNPKNEIAWCNKGDVLFKLQNLEEALDCYDKAIDLKPRYAIAWNNKGATLAMIGRFDEAKECYKKAIQLRPKYVAAWLNQGEVLVRLGRRTEAEKCLRRAKALGA